MTTTISHTATSASTSIPTAFSVYDSAFYRILGSAPKLEVILENNDFPFAHEASVYVPTTDELFMSSNMYTDPLTNQTTVKISKVSVTANPVTAEIINSTIPLPNGGVNHNGGILWTGQGTKNTTGGLWQMSAQSPNKAEFIVGGFYGRQFNSLNDVVAASDGSFWFTDPIYGWRQGSGRSPSCHAKFIGMILLLSLFALLQMASGRPNGISFSPDEKIVYITDTAETDGDGSTDVLKPATIYAFDLSTIGGQPFLINRRVFAMPSDGIPDGLKVDQHGNVYAGCGDGVNVWSSGGVLLGKILLKNGTSNFSFGKNGQMYILNENKVYRAQLNSTLHSTLWKN